MLLKTPEPEKIVWTKHSEDKIKYYGFSKKRVLNIFRKPTRREEGIAPKTLACMQRIGTKKNPREAWMMYVKRPKEIFIISAWRYPGITPIGQRPIIPEDALTELYQIIKK